MQPSDFIKKLFALLDNATDSYANSLPEIESRVADNVQDMFASLERDKKTGIIKASGKNFKELLKIKSDFDNILDGTDYTKVSTQYLAAYTTLANLSNQYFNAIVSDFSPSVAMKAVQSAAIDATIENLGKTGLLNAVNASLKTPILDLARNAMSTGGKYQDVIKNMRIIVTGGSLEGPIMRFAKPIAINSMHQFSRNYLNIGAIGLGLNWYQYAGGKVEDSRCWCLATLDLKYLHRSEFQKAIDMDFPDYDCEIYSKTGLPQGMISGTNSENLITNCGGFNCIHGLIPVPNDFVPEAIRGRII